MLAVWPSCKRISRWGGRTLHKLRGGSIPRPSVCLLSDGGGRSLGVLCGGSIQQPDLCLLPSPTRPGPRPCAVRLAVLHTADGGVSFFK
jgi:hypothetical protein